MYGSSSIGEKKLLSYLVTVIIKYLIIGRLLRKTGYKVYWKLITFSNFFLLKIGKDSLSEQY